ncbi:MAG: hypothetical protein ACJAS4_001356 [Bacteriovoracaceae bacterium]|jgi:hypothetical protein
MFKKLISLLFLITLISCGAEQKSDVKVSLGFAIAGDVVNKAMLSGFNTDTKERFARKVQSESFEFELSNGNWELYLTHWEDVDYFGADTSCKKMQVSLSGEPVDLVFDISLEGCKNYSDYFDTSTPSFYQTQLIACNATPTLDGSVDGSECDGDKDTSIQSYKIKLMAFQQDSGSEFIRFGTGLEVCIDANMDASAANTFEQSLGTLSNFIPIIDSKYSPFIVHLDTYSSAGCEGDLGKFEFNNGLQHSAEIKSHDSIWASSATNKENYLFLISGINIPSVFSPTDLSGLSLWLDGSDQTSMFSNTDCSSNVVTVTNDPVKCWRDKSGNGLHAIEATNPPKYDSLVQNSLSGIKFLDEILKVPDHTSLDGGSAISVYMVYQETSKDNVIRTLLDKSFSSQRTIQTYLGNSDKVINFTDDGATTSKTSYIFTSPVNTPELVSLEITNSGQTMMRDGSNDISSLDVASFPSTGSTVIETAGELKIGNSTVGSSSYLNGHVMEILYFDRELTAQEKLDVDAYLKLKWDL